jgi:hypothetical protein
VVEEETGYKEAIGQPKGREEGYFEFEGKERRKCKDHGPREYIADTTTFCQ